MMSTDDRGRAGSDGRSDELSSDELTSDEATETTAKATMDTTHAETTIESRIEALEGRLEEQQETIAEQRACIDDQRETIASQLAAIERQAARFEDELAAIPASPVGDPGALPVPTMSRRGALQAGGALGLLALGAGAVSAESSPQGRVGTADRPLTAVHAIDVDASTVEASTPDDTTGTTAVSGRATATGAAETTGVEGTADADGDLGQFPEVIPTGVHGRTTGENVTHAVRGTAESPWGRGVIGFATSDEYEHDSFGGLAAGIMGVTDRSGDDAGLDEAAGVVGFGTAESGTNFGVIGRSDSEDGWGVRGINAFGGYGVQSDGDSKTVGDNEITGDNQVGGDTTVGGELSFPDETPQRTAGPIAKGFINADGSIENAVNVNSAVWRDDEERYRIRVTDEWYFFNEYVTTVTPLTHVTPRVTSNNGDIIVEFRNSSGDQVQSGFQFVTHELPEGQQINTASTASTSAGAQTVETTADELEDGEGSRIDTSSPSIAPSSKS